MLSDHAVRWAVFVFHDYTDNDSANYPDQLRSQYTMSRVLGAGACGEVRLAFRKVSHSRHVQLRCLAEWCAGS